MVARTRWFIPGVTFTIAVVVTLDFALVACGFINVRDVGVYNASNPAADVIEAYDQPARTAFYLSQRNRAHPVYGNFCQREIDFLYPRDVVVPFLDDDYKALYNSMEQNVVRLWQLTNTRFILGSKEMLKSLTHNPAFQVRGAFNYDARGNLHAAAGADSQAMLLEFGAALPRALVYHQWESLPRGVALQKLADRTWDPWGSVLVSGGALVAGVAPVRATSPATITEYARTRIGISVDLPQAGVLLLNDKYDPDWRVAVDGKEAELLICNYIARGVFLPKGAHDVVFTYRPHLVYFLLSILPLVAVGVSCGMRWGRRKMKRAVVPK